MAGLFVGVGHSGLRIISRDGRSWEHPQVGKDGEVYRAVASGNGRCVAVGAYGGSNLFSVTGDGVAWKTQLRDAHYSTYLLGVAYGKERFLGVGGDPGAVGAARPFIMESKDGENWTEPVSIEGKFVLRRLAWGNGRWVGVGDRGRRATSEDGHRWQDGADAKAIETLIDVAFGQSLFVGVGLHGLRMVSEDGIRWSAPLRGEEGEHLNSVAWTGDRFTAVGLGATYFSPDGRKWERVPNQNPPLAVAYGNGAFVGSNWKGRLLHSIDAVHWELVHRAEQHVEAVGFVLSTA